jgi:hypothetical protein
LKLLRSGAKGKIFFSSRCNFFCSFFTNLDETIAPHSTSYTRTTPQSTLYHYYRTEKLQSANIHSTKQLGSSFLVRSAKIFSRKMKRKIRGATESEALWLERLSILSSCKAGKCECEWLAHALYPLASSYKSLNRLTLPGFLSQFSFTSREHQPERELKRKQRMQMMGIARRACMCQYAAGKENSPPRPPLAWF